jgi:prohibitin 2
MRPANEPPAFVIPLSVVIGVGLLIFVILILLTQVSYVVRPGNRGVAVTLGKVHPEFLPEGLGFKQPFVTRIVPITIRQRTQALKAECYSSDLQQINTALEVLYRIPENAVVRIYQQYAGDPFDSLIAPRVQEALKEVIAVQTAEMVVTNRFVIKSKALDLARQKIGTNFLEVRDLVIQDISLSKELENAIEQKMIQEQEAAKARFTQRKAEIEAQTAVIKARGEADSIRIRGQALDLTPAFIDWKIVEKWDGKSPLVVGQQGGASVMAPLTELEAISKASPPRK